MTSNQMVEVGTRLILRVALVAGLAVFLYLVRDVVLLALLSVLLTAALSPFVGRLHRRGMPRTVAVVLVYVALLFVIVGVLWFLVPLFVSEALDFARNWPAYSARFAGSLRFIEEYLAGFGLMFDIDSVLAGFQAQSILPSNLFSTTVGVFTGAIKVVVFFFLSLYLALEENGIENFFRTLTPARYHEYSLSIARRIQGKVGRWLFGQAILMLIIFLVYWVGLLFLDVPYALALAVLGGLLEIIPYVGPVIAAIPALLMALLISPVTAVGVLIFYIFAHQVESHVIAPQVMKRSAGINPVVLILAVLVGAKLGGPVGALIAVPLASILEFVVEDLLEKKRSSTLEHD